MTRVAAGTAHSLALKSDGSVWGWGANSNGELGIGTFDSGTSTPSVVTLAGGGSFASVAEVSASATHSLAVKSDGSLYAWGRNTLRALGDGTAVNRANPVPVLDAAGSPFNGVAQAAAGADFSVSLKSNGSVWVWGTYVAGSFGPVANPTQVLTSGGSALSGITRVSAGNGFFLALRSDGTVWAWGYNAYGTLGNGSTSTVAFSPTAVQVETAPGAPLTAVVDIATGWTHAIAVASDGRVYSWGQGYLGRTTTVAGGSRAGLVTNAAGTPISGVANAAAGENFTVLRNLDGTLVTFGDNVDGKLGANSSNLNEPWPVSVRESGGAVFTNAARISATSRHTLVLKQDGSVWGWGRNESGQLAAVPGVGTSAFVNPIRLPL